MDFAVSTDYNVNLKKCESRDQYVDLARELKKNLWNMKVAVISIVIHALGTITKGMLQELEDWEIDWKKQYKFHINVLYDWLVITFEITNKCIR